MFFFFSKLIPAFLFPLPAALLVLWFLFFKHRKKMGKREGTLLALLLSGFTILSTAPGAMLLVLPLEGMYYEPAKNPAGHFQTAIVAGGFGRPLRQGSELGLEFSDASDRILEALRLYRRGQVERILITGGSGLLAGEEMSESALARMWLEEVGVPRSAILIEDRSRNTIENAQYTRKILEGNPSGSCLLITSAFHMPRALATFRKAGVPCSPWAVDFMYKGKPLHFPEDFFLSPLHLLNSRIAIKEYLGLLVYKIKGSL